MIFDTKKFSGFKEELKAKFTASKLDPKVEELMYLHQSRINREIERRLTEARAYRAIDYAYDISQNQVSYSMMKDLVDSNPSVEDVQRLSKTWGFTDMVRPCRPGVSVPAGALPIMGSNGKPGYYLQLPVFFTVFIPLLLAYLKARWAKLSGDRDFFPLYSYDTNDQTIASRAAAKLVTAKVNTMAEATNMRAEQREMIFKTLLYSQALTFPEEAWWTEEQEGKVIREGVRITTPHPMRVGYDMDHPLYTFNSDSGCEWAFYWSIKRYGDIRSNPDYWIPKDSVNTGKRKGKSKKSSDPDTVFSDLSVSPSWRTGTTCADVMRFLYPCAFAFPGASVLPVKNERTQDAYSMFYGNTTQDAGIDVAVMYHKINPKKWGLYDYDGMVWHRFVYAGATRVIFAEPILYSPITASLYDYSADRTRNSSLGKELGPFQDALSNIFQQQLLTVKKNLIRVVGADTEVISDDFLAQFANNSENSLRGIEFLKFKGSALRDKEKTIQGALFPLVFRRGRAV